MKEAKKMLAAIVDEGGWTAALFLTDSSLA
jgi:hypothetical protein